MNRRGISFRKGPEDLSFRRKRNKSGAGSVQKQLLTFYPEEKAKVLWRQELFMSKQKKQRCGIRAQWSNRQTKESTKEPVAF